MAADLIQQIRKAVTPPTWDSWKTLVWISVFSWAVALLAGTVVEWIISFIGWLFLIPGIHWGIHKEDFFKKSLKVGGFFLGSWITGALVCFFVFGCFLGGFSPWTVVCWPPVSAIISGLPKFIKSGPKYELPAPAARQELVILLLSNLLLSCWLQLYFSTQIWLNDYPSLLADDLSKSAFVIKMSPEENTNSRGIVILQQTENTVKEALLNQPWAKVERWLLELNPQMKQVQTIVKDRLTKIEENSLWQVRGRILQGEYTVQLFAVWQGPSVSGNGYYLSKTCQVKRAERETPETQATEGKQPQKTKTEVAAEILCGPIEGPTGGQPNFDPR